MHHRSYDEKKKYSSSIHSNHDLCIFVWMRFIPLYYTLDMVTKIACSAAFSLVLFFYIPFPLLFNTSFWPISQKHNENLFNTFQFVRSFSFQVRRILLLLVFFYCVVLQLFRFFVRPITRTMLRGDFLAVLPSFILCFPVYMQLTHTKICWLVD